MDQVRAVLEDLLDFMVLHLLALVSESESEVVEADFESLVVLVLLVVGLLQFLKGLPDLLEVINLTGASSDQADEIHLIKTAGVIRIDLPLHVLHLGLGWIDVQCTDY